MQIKKCNFHSYGGLSTFLNTDEATILRSSFEGHDSKNSLGNLAITRGLLVKDMYKLILEMDEFINFYGTQGGGIHIENNKDDRITELNFNTLVLD